MARPPKKAPWYAVPPGSHPRQPGVGVPLPRRGSAAFTTPYEFGGGELVSQRTPYHPIAHIISHIVANHVLHTIGQHINNTMQGGGGTAPAPAPTAQPYAGSVSYGNRRMF